MPSLIMSEQDLSDIPILERAILIATAAHVEQLDKSGMPYILHPLAVMAKVADLGEDAMAIAVLHDVIEDTDWDYYKLACVMGDEIAAGVQALSKMKDGPRSYIEYIEDLADSGDHVIMIKLADLEHNMSLDRTPEFSKEFAGLKKRDVDAYFFLQRVLAGDDPVW